MRSIKTTTGVEIRSTATCSPSSKRSSMRSPPKVLEGGQFEDMNREINHLCRQLNDEELRAYLAESLFLNQVKYENDRLESYMKKLSKNVSAESS